MQDDVYVVRSGRLFIILSTFVGGHRYMIQNIHYILEISNNVGHTDIFITITCMLNNREVARSLLPAQKSVDLPDLAARGFRFNMRSVTLYVIDEN